MPLRHRVHAGDELDLSAKTLLTFGDNLVEGGAILWGFTIVNRSASSRTVFVSLVPAAGSPAESNCIFEEVIPPHSTVGFGGPWHENSLAFISATTDNASSDVGIRVTASEEYLR